MQGYIKLYRKIIDSSVWSDPHYLKLWLYCLIKATHKERNVIVGNQTITLQPGQFITGRKSLTEDLNQGMKPKLRLNESTWWRYLNNLEKMEMLHIKKTNKYSIVSIVNWNEYQENEQQMNIKRTSDEHQMNTNKNVKNDKNVNNIVVDIDPTGNYEQTIKQRYMQLAAIRGFDVPPKDIQAIHQVIEAGVPLETALTLLEQCFAEYQPRHPRDKINSFNYCATYILNKYFAESAGESNGGKNYSRNTGRTPKEKPVLHSITGGQVGWIRRKGV